MLEEKDRHKFPFHYFENKSMIKNNEKTQIIWDF